jgi:glyoxylase-like metal-dependent hydrolase (beta-lactamase superfamily II)
LFSGDIVFGESYPTLLSHDGSPFALIEALQKITDTDVEIIIPGHGATCDKEMAKRLIEYWKCLTSECRKVIPSGVNDEKIKEILGNRCHLPMVPINERKHKRNIDSVLKFVRDHPA